MACDVRQFILDHLSVKFSLILSFLKSLKPRLHPKLNVRDPDYVRAIIYLFFDALAFLPLLILFLDLFNEPVYLRVHLFLVLVCMLEVLLDELDLLGNGFIVDFFDFLLKHPLPVDFLLLHLLEVILELHVLQEL